MWTIGSVIDWAADDLKKRGSDSARLDAELLLGDTLGLSRLQLVLEVKRPLAESELARFKAGFKRRRGGEPIAYILGEREFFGLPIRVDRRVLIPRPDTEILVEVALSRTRDRYMYGRLLDVFTGSGCVALAFARQRRTWHVTASDISEEALRVARDNALRLGLVHRVGFSAGHLFSGLKGRRFETITANPPYIPSSEISELMVDVRDYEPRLALDGGDDGLSLVSPLVSEAREHLVPGGLLACEVGAGQAPSVAELFVAAGYGTVEVRKDYAGNERVVSGRIATV